MLQVDRDAVEVVHPPGTHEARRIDGIGRLWPSGFRIEHSVIHDELAASIKQVLQGYAATLAFEGVVLVYQLPRKLAALATQLVAHVRERRANAALRISVAGQLGRADDDPRRVHARAARRRHSSVRGRVWLCEPATRVAGA